MNTAELKDLKHAALCERIAVIWSAGWGIASVLLLVALWPHFAWAQTIKINSDLGPVPADMVTEAAWSIEQRLGINLDIVGTSHVDCEQGHIIVRRASPAEWAGFGFAPEAYAVASPCAGAGWGQVIWHPTKPFTLIGLRHELGHASGCWGHLWINPANVMQSDPFESALTAADISCIKMSNWWPRSGGDECFVELASDMSLYIPSIGGLAVWLDHAGGNDWTLVRSRATAQSCPGNTLAGPVAEFDDIRGYGMVPLTYGRMRNVGGNTWRLEAAR